MRNLKKEDVQKKMSEIKTEKQQPEPAKNSSKSEKAENSSGKKNYTYILRCGDGSLYTGWTTDIDKRLEEHRSGKGARYTRGRGPLTLVHLEVFDTKSEAMKREASIKRLSRAQKEELIAAIAACDAAESVQITDERSDEERTAASLHSLKI